MPDAGSGTMRTCGHPLCPRTFDIAATLAGEPAGEAGWRHSRLASYLCPTHGTGDHVPNLRYAERLGIPTCSCGWAGDAGSPLLAIRVQWELHVIASVEVV